MTEPNPYSDGEYTWGPDQQSASPAYGYPGPAPEYSATVPGGVPLPALPSGPSGAGAPLMSVGDITVLQDCIVTPAGTLPLKGAVWNATDMSHTEENIPVYAIVLMILFLWFFLLGLLFLLIKERKTTGYIQVSVTSGGKHHSTMVPSRHPSDFMTVMGRISYARSLSGM